jgi:hypothetical protein
MNISKSNMKLLLNDGNWQNVSGNKKTENLYRLNLQIRPFDTAVLFIDG